MRLIGATLRKLVHRPATRNSLIALAALLALVYVSVGATARTMDDPEMRDGVAAIVTFPEAYGNLAAFLATFLGLAAAAWAGAIAGAEWSWGTFRLAIARGESRVRYVLATFAGAAALMLVGWIVLFGAGLVFAVIGAAVGGLAVGNAAHGSAVGRIPLMLAAGWWSVVLSGAFGFAVAFIARSQVAGIVAVVALYFGEQFATLVVPPDVLRFAPITVSSTLAAEAARVSGGADLGIPLVATTAYLLVVLGAAAIVADRSEVA